MKKTAKLLGALAALLIAAAAAPPVPACLWDRDTLAAEAEGLPSVANALVGNIERNPPLYYEMRLERVAGEIAERPWELELYDDAGVACDRLGRSDEAIAWMEKKRAELDRLSADAPQKAEHEYRYLANLGTFYAHRWMRDGADRGRIAEVERARDLIAAAIELNPDAHFGREKYQLSVLDWIIEIPNDWKGPVSIVLSPASAEESLNAITLREYQYSDNPHDELAQYHMWALTKGLLHPTESSQSEEVDTDQAIKGIVGLMVLGGGAESIDLVYTLGLLMDKNGDQALSHLAEMRMRELDAEGHRSLNPNSFSGEALWKLKPLHPFRLEPDLEADAKIFPVVREEAKDAERHRTDFMINRLLKGEHPDTHPSFWDGFRPRRVDFRPPMERAAIAAGMPVNVLWAMIGVASICAILIGVCMLRWARS